MPTRLLREGILSSQRVNALPPLAELFYRRLMSVVDDYGRFYAAPMQLRAACYPLRLDSVRDAEIAKWLAACVASRLVAVYEVAGLRYLQMLDFRQQVRAKKSKFPDPTDASHLPSECVAPAAPAKGNGEDPTPIVERIPITGDEEFAVHESFVRELERAYPAVNVARTLTEARAWCLSNPARRKTRAGVKRFLNGWMAKEQNRGPQNPR